LCTANVPIVHNLSCGHLATKMAMRIFPIRLVAGALCLLLFCGGCSIRRVAFNERITAEQTSFIHAGETTLRQIVDQIGAPDEMTESESGAVALYRWSDTKSASLNMTAIIRLFTPYSPSLTLNNTGVTTEVLEVLFDPDWTVRAYGFTRHRMEEPIMWFWPL